MLVEGEQNPIFAAKTLSKALDLRESIYGVLSPAAQGASPGEADLSGFNQHLSDALLHSKIASSGDRFSWSWDNAGAPSDRIIWTLAREAANLITSGEIKRVGECADDRGCGLPVYRYQPQPQPSLVQHGESAATAPRPSATTTRFLASNYCKMGDFISPFPGEIFVIIKKCWIE